MLNQYAYKLLVLGVLFFSCTTIAIGGKNFPPGIVAVVNDQPISLREVEALYDTTEVFLKLEDTPEVHTLQKKYGDNLYTLIIYALMSQELEKIGCKVSDEELLQAEEEVKKDYKGEDFEKSLEEEYLDMVSWRLLMRQRITLQKFQKNILRPQITISSDEVEQYYNNHIADFFIPEKVEIIWYQELGVQKNLSRKGVGTNTQGPSEHGEVMKIAINRLPEKMHQDLLETKIGEYTPRRKEGEIYQYAYLRNRFPERQATVVEAYSQIELLLLEQKMESAYEHWLEQTLARASIKVCPQFQPKEVINLENSSTKT